MPKRLTKLPPPTDGSPSKRPPRPPRPKDAKGRFLPTSQEDQVAIRQARYLEKKDRERKIAKVYRDVARRIADAAPGSTFTHHAGHGIGLAGYEAPFLAPFDDSELREGMVLAIEPGCYFAGRLGVRVERNYVLTSRGAVELPGRSGRPGRD